MSLWGCLLFRKVKLFAIDSENEPYEVKAVLGTKFPSLVAINLWNSI